MKINVHIEHLILEGLPAAKRQGPLVQAAVEAELARLLALNGLSPELRPGGAVPGVSASSIQLDRQRHPTGLGRRIARAVYSGIGDGTRATSHVNSKRGGE